MWRRCGTSEFRTASGPGFLWSCILSYNRSLLPILSLLNQRYTQTATLLLGVWLQLTEMPRPAGLCPYGSHYNGDDHATLPALLSDVMWVRKVFRCVLLSNSQACLPSKGSSIVQLFNENLCSCQSCSLPQCLQTPLGSRALMHWLYW